MKLDDLTMSTEAKDRILDTQLAKFPVEQAIAVGTEPVIQGEENHTTYLALAEFYDAKRDASMSQLSVTIAGYGAEVEKRGKGMTSYAAHTFLRESRRLLDAAEAAQAKAKLYHDAKARS